MPRDVTLSALFVGGLLALAAIGVRMTQTGRQVSSAATARSSEAAVDSQAPQSEHAAPMPAPLGANLPHSRSVLPAPTPSRSPPQEASDEAALMDRLRQLIDADPELCLLLAREANARYPDSPDAAERATMVVKSLMRMGRAAEATAEAREMVERYAGSAWALDVRRHMLDVPP